MIEYLAIPYSHNNPDVRELRFELANKVAAALMREGRVIFSPISHTHPLVKYGLPTDWEYWKTQDEHFLNICGRLIVVMAAGWKESDGVQAEIAHVEKRGLRVIYIDPNDY